MIHPDMKKANEFIHLGNPLASLFCGVIHGEPGLAVTGWPGVGSIPHRLEKMSWTELGGTGSVQQVPRAWTGGMLLRASPSIAAIARLR